MEEQGDSQPEGYYPRLNSKLLLSGRYINQIVSVVGHFQSAAANADGTVPFQTSDGGVISLSTECVEVPLIGPDSPPYEAIGQAIDGGVVTVREDEKNG
jgi:hypothetical protein